MSQITSPFFLAGSMLYVAGTFLVTGLGNVPLNKQLAAVAASAAAAPRLWEHYLNRWTILNTIRTATAIAAAALFTVGLLQDGSAAAWPR